MPWHAAQLTLNDARPAAASAGVRGGGGGSAAATVEPRSHRATTQARVIGRSYHARAAAIDSAPIDAHLGLGMAAVRAWHPIRLALVCAALAMAGSAPAARAVYAEVSARAAAAVRSDAQRRAVAVAADDARPTAPPPLAAGAVARPAAPALVVARLYLAHCALLL